ncbi:Protein phosphatase 1 regulatory inhibitor subunit 16B [Labeo rohita]|uniref:Protein phosphatase 1 regulatory inhibitor subunit 16B n=1 Tax=Labeo rohita TaxID=84645 RepID=A0ABQ8MMM8_LABRO|nr:Protein phosphatase 1 regulatory inhibitor subunit 16B [Labeo rohita]
MSVFEISLYDKHRKCFAHFTSGKLLSGRDESGVFICSLMCKAHVPQKVSACGLINDCGKSPNVRQKDARYIGLCCALQLPPRSGRLPPIMANHLELLTELQQLDKVPSLERLRAAQKRRTQQLKRWAVYEKEMQNKKRKADKRRGHGNLLENRKRVSFSASVALLEASARNDPDEASVAARTPKLLCGGERVLQRRSECEIMGLKAAENDSGGQMSVCRRSESLGKTLCSRMMKTACRSQRRCREMRCDGSSGWICSRFNPADYRCGVISAWAITLFLMELFLPRLTRSATY